MDKEFVPSTREVPEFERSSHMDKEFEHTHMVPDLKTKLIKSLCVAGSGYHQPLDICGGMNERIHPFLAQYSFTHYHLTDKSDQVVLIALHNSCYSGPYNRPAGAVVLTFSFRIATTVTYATYYAPEQMDVFHRCHPEYEDIPAKLLSRFGTPAILSGTVTKGAVSGTE